jgi:16S rRNA (uracil1498-N3)-methyltransferase
MQLFYAPDIKLDYHVFDQEESRHAIKVLRLKKGDILHVTDGKGNLYETEIIEDDIKKCAVKIINTTEQYGTRDYYLHIAIAPTKNIKRFEWFLEKATEIGIDEITPVLCDHSERKNIRHDRMGKILVSAMKQSVKAYLPQLNDMTNIRKLISESNEEMKTIAIADEEDKQHLKDLFTSRKEILVLIGPEGDFSTEEIQEAKEKEFVPVSLGRSRLRTETAGIVACNIVNVVREE